MEIKVLLDEEKIKQGVQSIARKIEQDFKEEEIVLLCILKGSVVFLTDLAREIHNKTIFEFMQVSSYVGTESTGVINLRLDVRDSLDGKNVIVVEDIIDTGHTLKSLLFYIKEHHNPKTLKLCTFLDKPSRRVDDVKVDYTAYTIEDKFVIGYGLDFDEEYRDLPYVGYIEN